MASLQEQINASRNMQAQLSAPRQSGSSPVTQAYLTSEIGSQSALNSWDRFKYGFADNQGKRNIIMNATGQNPVQLKNGEYGVQVEVNGIKAIRPVDPKGFQVKDLGGDLAESVGKAITTTGAIGGGILGTAAAGVGAVPGAAGGAVAGETIRQLIGAGMGVRNKENLTKLLTADEQGIHLGGIGEILGEASLAGLGEQAGRLIGGKLAQYGATKSVAALDDIPITGEIKPTTLDALQNMLGLPKNTNKRLLKEYLPGGSIKYVPHEDAVIEHIRRTGDKAIKISEQGKNIIDDIYSRRLQDAGVDTSVTMVDASKGIKEIDNSISKLMNSPLKNDAAPIVKQLSDLKDWVSTRAANGKISLDDIREATGALAGIKSQTFPGGMAGKFTSSANRPLAAFTSAKNSIPIIKELNQQYGPQIRAIKRLQNILNIRLEEGLAKEGRFTPEMFISRLSNELKDRSLEAIIKADDVLSKSPEFKNLSIKEDLLTSLFAQKLSEQMPKTGYRLSLSGIAEGVTKSILPPSRRAKIVKGLMNSGMLDANAINKSTSKEFPKVSALLNLIGGAEVPKKVAAVAGKGLKVAGPVIPRSLNSIIYGNDQ